MATSTMTDIEENVRQQEQEEQERLFGYCSNNAPLTIFVCCFLPVMLVAIGFFLLPGLIVAILAIVIIIILVVCSRQYLQPDNSNNTAAAEQEQPKPEPVLSREQVDEKLVPMDRECIQEEEMCEVCLVEFGTTDTVVVGSNNPDCTHVYHLECIVSWLLSDANKNTCPKCRAPYIIIETENEAALVENESVDPVGS